MADRRSIPRATVFQVLQTVLPGLGVSVRIEGNFALLENNDGEILEAHPLPAYVPTKKLEYFERKFGIKVEFFLNPEMCVKGTDTQN